MTQPANEDLLCPHCGYNLRAARNLVAWEPCNGLCDGYTVVIGCMKSLWPVAIAAAEMIVASDRKYCNEIFLVFDCAVEDLPQPVVDWCKRFGGKGTVKLLGYTASQARIASWIRWGWVYAWMSWSIGISESRSRYVILHDLDAMLTGKCLLDRIYIAASSGGHRFYGTRRYSGNGVTSDMHIATTFELAIDVSYVRDKFSPIHGFNRTALLNGHYVDFDTFLWMQHKTGPSLIMNYDSRELVHPTQLICNYTDLIAGRCDLSQMDHGLVMLEYFRHLGGDGRLSEVAKYLENPQSGGIPISSRHFPIKHITPEYWAWTEKQVRIIEQAKFGKTRPEVEGFLRGIIFRAGEARTVGVEPPECGGVGCF